MWKGPVERLEGDRPPGSVAVWPVLPCAAHPQWSAWARSCRTSRRCWSRGRACPPSRRRWAPEGWTVRRWRAFCRCLRSCSGRSRAWRTARRTRTGCVPARARALCNAGGYECRRKRPHPEGGGDWGPQLFAIVRNFAQFPAVFPQFLFACPPCVLVGVFCLCAQPLQDNTLQFGHRDFPKFFVNGCYAPRLQFPLPPPAPSQATTMEQNPSALV